MSSIGGLARNFTNKLMLAFYEFIGEMFILEVELHTVWHTLFYTKHYNWFNVWIETDSKAVVSLINGQKSGPWQCQGMVFLIKQIIFDLRGCVTHVIREGNCGTDYLAKKGILNYTDAKWTNRGKDEGLRGLICANEFQYIRIRHV